MVVQVHRKREHSRPRSKARFSVLGNSLLDRTRSTTFGLLGMTAAVGLAIIAVALQGGWPLIEGSRVPRAPVLHESVGEATALNGSTPRTAVRPGSAGGKRSAASHGGQTSVPARPPVAPSAAPPVELVSSPAAPVGHQGGHGNGSHGSPTPQEQAPPSPPSQPAQAPSGAVPTTQPSTSPAPEPPPPSPPEAIASEAPPVESNVPPWSNGQGHAYGRDDDEGHGCGHGPGGRAGD